MTNELHNELDRRVHEMLQSELTESTDTGPARQQAVWAAVLERTDQSSSTTTKPRVRATWRRPTLVGLAAAVVAAVSFTPLLLSPTMSSADTILHHAIELTSNQAPVPALGAGQYYYEAVHVSAIAACRLSTLPDGSRELDGGLANDLPYFVYEQTDTSQSWTGADGSGGATATDISGHFITAAQQRQWVTDGSPSLTHCVPSSGVFTTTPPLSTGERGVTTLPTSPSELGNLLAHGRVGPEGEVYPTNTECPASQTGICTTATQFDIAWNLLSSATEAPQLLGPVLYAILAKLPGVTDFGSVTDANGQVGAGIAYNSEILVIDPTTGRLLATETVASSSDLAAGGVSQGDVTSAETFGTLLVVNHLGATSNS